MEQFKRVLKWLLDPGTGVVIAGILLTVFLMVYIFGFGHEGEPVAYAAYLLSAYSAVILGVWLAKRIRRRLQLLTAYLRKKNRYIDRWFSDPAFKSLVSIYLSAGANILFVLIKLCAGMFYHSVWLVTLAVYYGILFTMRVLLLQRAAASRVGTDLLAEFKRYRVCAIVILFLNATLTGMVVLAINMGEGFRYGDMLIYIMAMYDFYIVITATTNLVKARKHGSPLLSAARVVSLASALISILSLETAMIAEFGSAEDAQFRSILLAVTGGAVAAIFIGMSIYMLVRSGREIDRLKSTALKGDSSI